MIKLFCLTFSCIRMGGKLEDLNFKKRNFVPGPGTHSPEKKQDGPKMVFGTGSRSDLVMKTSSPGPGNYASNAEKLKASAPSFGFGTS